MLSFMFGKVRLTACAKKARPSPAPLRAGWRAGCAVALLTAMAGCESAPQHSNSPPQPSAHSSPGSTNDAPMNSSISLVLHEGDTIKISFPGAPNLDSTQPIRRDGKVTLELIGEYDAAGKTPSAMEADLKKLYSTQIVNSEVSVTVISSAFVVRVMGAVLKPGKIISDRPLNILEALIEAGIDNTKSNLKAVQVLRLDKEGHAEKFKLNLYKVLHTKNEPMPSFTLKSDDIINVPERFSFIQ